MIVLLFIATLVAGAPITTIDPPQYGEYEVGMADYDVPTLDSTDPRAVVVYPIGNFANGSLPMIAYAHGAGGGGVLTYPGYKALLDGLASFGFIVIAPRSCSVGCRDTNGWSLYYEEQLKVITWSQNMTTDPILRMVDHSPARGYAIAGHSMGGDASTSSAAFANEYNIKCAILHHPYRNNGGANIQVPTAAYTGTLDSCCGNETTKNIWDPAPRPKVYANMVGALHTEPNLIRCRWTLYTAAWAKIWLNEDPTGVYHSYIYDQTNPDSLCNGYEMEECILYED